MEQQQDVNMLHRLLLLAVIGFQQFYEEQAQEEQTEHELLTETEKEAWLEENEFEYPEEISTDAYIDKFVDWLTSGGLDDFQGAKLNVDTDRRLDRLLSKP